jgi:tetratricopeptide (TPR) repeat protein
MRPVHRLVALVVAAGLAGGCASSGWRWTWPPTWPWASRPNDSVAAPSAPASGESPLPSARDAGRNDATALVDRAGVYAREGKPTAARDLYERVIREYPEDPARPAALYGLGLLQSDPTGPLRDYRAAYGTFGRLLSEHPRGRWEADARRWRAMLNEVMTREEETTRLKNQLERLKKIEVESDRFR